MGSICHTTSRELLLKKYYNIFIIYFYLYQNNLQQRLRNLIQILGYNLHSDPENKTLFYYTLHLTTMCAPFYTSEKIYGCNPKWAKIDVCNSIGSAKGM